MTLTLETIIPPELHYDISSHHSYELNEFLLFLNSLWGASVFKRSVHYVNKEGSTVSEHAFDIIFFPRTTEKFIWSAAYISSFFSFLFFGKIEFHCLRWSYFSLWCECSNTFQIIFYM